MSQTPLLPGFVYLKSFERAAKGELTEDDRANLERELCANPEVGSAMVGTGGVRKMRFGREGEGKRGGLRVIYYYRNQVGRIYMLTMYPKNVQDNLSRDVRNAMKALTAQLDRDR
ncbi:MAG: type II toxin-antitoxin system RelE/ParE family toxin [Gemmatimonadaceae bacterium]